MTALHMIWAGSAAGAAVFFALGYVMRVLVRAAPDGAQEASSASAAASDRAELGRLRLAVEAAERARADLARQLAERAAAEDAEGARDRAAKGDAPSEAAPGQRVEELEAALAAAVASKQEVDSALSVARAEIEGLDRSVANAERAAQREAERRAKAEEERLEAKAELATVRAEMKAIVEARGNLAQSLASGKDRGLGQALREENAALRLEVERRARAADQLESMRTARDKAERTLREVETELHSLRAEASRADDARRRLEAAEREAARLRDGGSRAEVAEEELRRLRQDMDSLKRDLRDAEARARQAEGSRSRVDELEWHRERIRSLETQLAAAGLEPARERGARESGGGDRLSYVGLDIALSSLAAVAGLRAAVVADDMGLVIAAAGGEEHREDVAALAGLARQLAERARHLLALDQIRQIVLEDSKRALLTCRFFKIGGSEIALSMLGSEAPPPRELVDKHVRSLLKNLG